MTTIDDQKLSKYLSLVLRHQPGLLNLNIDENGWARIRDIVKHKDFNWKTLERIVNEDPKGRYSIDKSGKYVRANYGHSIGSVLAATVNEPPQTLLHGTSYKYLTSILRDGLNRQNRQYVHLTTDQQTAHEVGKRHGSPVILRIQTAIMNHQGYPFYEAENGLWLVSYVPPSYIQKPT